MHWFLHSSLCRAGSSGAEPARAQRVVRRFGRRSISAFVSRGEPEVKAANAHPLRLHGKHLPLAERGGRVSEPAGSARAAAVGRDRFGGHARLSRRRAARRAMRSPPRVDAASTLSTLRARMVRASDFDYFDLILAMDEQNLRELRRRAPAHRHERIRLMMEFVPQAAGARRAGSVLRRAAGLRAGAGPARRSCGRIVAGDAESG